MNQNQQLPNSGTTKLVIGLFGFGVVGEGLYRVLLQTPALNATIKKVCIKHPEKKRNAPPELFTNSKEELLGDDEINVIAEVIDDSVAAFDIVSSALLNGKNVVSASKKMIAENFEQLLELQRTTGKSFLYEASACASIPVIRNLEEYYDNDLLHGIQAIVNGSTNFILTKMFEEKLGYQKALGEAQQLGFAESDPSLDVEGWDAVNKWSNLLVHAYGIITKPANILFTGIHHIQALDAKVAAEKDCVIRLVAQAKKMKDGTVAAVVLPQFVPHHHPLAFVRNEYNGVVIESSFADRQFFYGKGAGSFATASAVLSDISALNYGYRYAYKKLGQNGQRRLNNFFFLRVYVSADSHLHLPYESFEWVEAFHAQEQKKYLIGVLDVQHLINNSWWRNEGYSLVLLPDAIIEPDEINDLRVPGIRPNTIFTDGVTN